MGEPPGEILIAAERTSLPHLRSGGVDSMASNPAPTHLPPFTPAERAGLRDFWEVFQADFAAIQAAAGATFADRPRLAAFARGGPRAEAEQRGLVSRERLRRALVDLEVEPYAAELRETGRRLALEGVDLASWVELIGAPRTAAVP